MMVDRGAPVVRDARSVRETLQDAISEAGRRAQRLGRAVLASVSLDVPGDLDVAAAIFHSRTAEERYFVWEHPDRGGFAIGCLGSAWTVEESAAERRFEDAAARCAEVMRDSVTVGEPGPFWVGGFAFSPDGGIEPHWASLPPTLLTLPDLSVVRRSGAASATLNVVCRPGEDGEASARTVSARLEGLRGAPMPLSDPDPVGGYRIASVLPPQHYVQAVAQARDAIRAGELEKVVLAREVRVEAPTPFRPAAAFDGLRSAYPTCYCFCVGTGDAAFIGASPELLVRREGAGAVTVALAGSTRRSADPAVDDHLGERLLQSAKDRQEHEIVARRIVRSLNPLSVWVAAAEEPHLIKVANIQHLATPVRAQLAEPRSAVELAGVLHPTPAVGGEPWPRARQLMGELEQLDRGWYAGPVGWMDASEDGEFCVGLRSALLEGRAAHCFAGNGIVADSDPEAELAETEVKLQAVLPVLIGA
jgi:isochorismate synthase